MPLASPLDVVEDVVRRRGGDLVELSHAIHAEPELAFAEHRSCAKAQALVAERGFEVTAGAAGLDTAFRADFGIGPLVVGICAEYDALPEIGHACGHNIIAASAVGTALALSEVADDLGLRIALLGTPAEEAGGGKALMLQAGTFDDVAVAVMVHPGPTDIAAARSLALSEAIVHYLGKESHAAVAPYLGLNAADAVTVAQVAIGLLRQQLAPGQMMHGIVTDGGQAVNVIPGHATLQYAMRAVESDSLRELEGRMFACFAAGALAAGCEYEIDNPAPAYDELKPDHWLAEICRDEMRRLGREPVTPEIEATLPMGSTDMGNVTQVLPGIHPVIGVDAGGATVHQRAFAAAAAGPSADRAVVDGAIMLARTIVHLAQNSAERDRVLAAQQLRARSDRKRGEAGRSGSRPSAASDRKRGEAGRSGSRPSASGAAG
jgi:amidohydrolase